MACERPGCRSDLQLLTTHKMRSREQKEFAKFNIGVRRDTAALSSKRKSHSAIDPAGSNRSSHEGNEVAKAAGDLNRESR
jgi:hypothetical protein